MKAEEAKQLMEQLAEIGDTMRYVVEMLELGDREAEDTQSKLVAAAAPMRAVAELLEVFSGAVVGVQTRNETYDGQAVARVAGGLRTLADLLDAARWVDSEWHEQIDAAIPVAIEGREVLEALSNIEFVSSEALPEVRVKPTTRSVVEDLLANPPINKADCLRRLRGLDLADVRAELVRCSTITTMTEERCQAVADVLHAIGPEGAVDELERVVSSLDLPLPSRYWALTVLVRGWPTRPEHLFRTLPDGGATLYRHGITHAMQRVPASPGQGVALMARVARDNKYRELLFEAVERNRVQLGVPALAAYGAAVESGTAQAAEPVMLRAIGKEPGPVAAKWVAKLRESTKEPDRRKALGKVVSAVRRARLSGRTRRRRHGHDGVAYVGSGEGAPDIRMVAVFAEADGGATSILAVMDAEHNLELAKAWRSRSYAEATERPGRMSSMSPVTNAKVSLADAAALMVQTLRHGLPRDPGARTALVYFDRAHDPSVQVPAPEPAPEAPEDEVRGLLSRPEYRSWRYAREIAGLFHDEPVRLDPKERKLDAHERARLVLAAHNMARFHAYRGEHDLGRLILAAARVTEELGTDSALFRAMSELPVEGRSMIDALVAPDVDAPDNPERRRQIKRVLFASLDEPRGSNLALLDLTSRLASCEGSLWMAALGACQGLPQDFDRLAHAIAKRFLTHVDPGEPLNIEAAANEIKAVIRRTTALPDEEAVRLAYGSVTTLVAFVNKACSVCSVRCLDDPDMDAGDAFFASTHPLSWPKQVH